MYNLSNENSGGKLKTPDVRFELTKKVRRGVWVSFLETFKARSLRPVINSARKTLLFKKFFLRSLNLLNFLFEGT